MTSTSGVRRFIRRWRLAFVQRGATPHLGALWRSATAEECRKLEKLSAFWERAAVSAELEENRPRREEIALQRELHTGYGDFDWQWRQKMHDAVRLFGREVRMYQEYRARVVDLNWERKETDEFLKKMEKRFTKEITVVHSLSLKTVLRKYVDNLRYDQQRITAHEHEHWSEVDNVYEFILQAPHYRKRPIRLSDLDARFQVRLAALFRMHVPRTVLSLRTLARLIVLFYICADFAEERHGKLVITQTGRSLTVTGVEQRLRGAQLERELAGLRRV